MDHLIAFLFTFILIIQYMYVLGGPVAKSADISLPHFIILSSHRYSNATRTTHETSQGLHVSVPGFRPIRSNLFVGPSHKIILKGT